MSKVSILKCNSYLQSELDEKISLSFDNIINLNNILNNDSRVFIKLNLVGPFDKDKGITTHPNVLRSVVKIIKKYTNNIIVGDNPAVRDMVYTMKKTGIYDVIQEENLKILNQKNLTIISSKNYKVYKDFEITKEMIDCDVLINLPKLKTHSLAYMTCAQKNFFGTIVGLEKSKWHVKARSPLEFADAINDLYSAIKDCFENKYIINICDGIIGLEGEGPSSAGITKCANVLISSLDAISLDRVACEVVNLNQEKLFITNEAGNRKLGIDNLNEIELCGDDINLFKDLKFLEPKDSLSVVGLRILKIKFLRNMLMEHPIINPEKCIKCGECVKICPPKTMQIDKKHKYPHLKTTNCIRCWCCAEVCPQNAIEKSKRPILGRIIFKR